KKVEIHCFVPLTLRATRAFPSIIDGRGLSLQINLPVASSHIIDSTRILKRETGVQINLEKNIGDARPGRMGAETDS
ncbi:MAG: hypothetical protein J6X44_05725, partial [Thermoguttaceae bacterium]|nr:hypothetical protein [Thermoguttaceae bacterium]